MKNRMSFRRSLTPTLNIFISWKYTRGYVFDGNFKAESLKMKNPEDDVWLSDGHGFFVTNRPYKEHLKVAKEVKEASHMNYFAQWLMVPFRQELVIHIMPSTGQIWFEVI